MTTEDHLHLRWNTHDGKHRLKTIIEAIRNNQPFERLLVGFPYAEEVDNGRDLRSAPLDGLDLKSADLADTDLTGASMRQVDLTGADLSGADLRSADLRESSLEDADLNGADITGACFSALGFQGWKIKGIRCEYLLFGHHDQTKEHLTRKDFKPGQFELLFTMA